MWFLKSLHSATVYYIRPDIPKHIVSRSTGHLIIPDDLSISRNHAFLCPEVDSLKLIDAGSRYGTFLNYAIESDREEIPRDVPVRLSRGDRIRFGKCKSLWTVDRVEFNCITSTVNVDERELLKETLQKLGGSIDDNFKVGRTSFLIMNTIITTPKLLMCLTAQIPVIKPEYLEECRKAMESGLALPDPDDFIPEFKEAYVRGEGMTFKRVAQRETLFSDKQFVFLKPQHMAQYETIINLAGGKCICAQKRKIAKSFFTEPTVVVIQASSTDALSQASSQAIDGLTQIVTKVGKRLIPEAEIGLAILYCSLTKYCNPDYKFASILDLESVPLSHGEMLAKSSEGQQVIPLKESISIPETESRDSSQMSQLVQQSGSIEDNKQNKKCLDVASEPVKGKRKHSEPPVSPKVAKRLRSNTEVKDAPLQNELEIPETPTEQSSEYKMPQLSGFLSVNHTESPLQPVQSSTQKQKRPLNLMLDDGEEDLFNFANVAQKRTKRQPTLSESFSASHSQKRSNQKPNDDLFSFGEGTSKRAKRRNAENTDSSDTVFPKSTTAEHTARTSSTSTSYRQFIRPIQIPTDGWLSASLNDLKFEERDGDRDDNDNSPSVEKNKIKEEPNEEEQKTRIWMKGMEAMFQVKVKCMNLTSHRPGQSAGDKSFNFTENTSINVNGAKNFKAFVKRHNYKPQQTIIRTMPVCVLDNTQDDHF